MSPPPPPSPSPSQESDRLQAMAASLGITVSYRDVFGTAHHASDESLLAVAGALVGLPGASMSEVVAAVERQHEAHAARMVSQVVVVWLPGPVTMELTIPSDGRDISVTVTLDPHGPDGGDVRTLDVDVAALTPMSGGSTHGSQPRPTHLIDLDSLELPMGRHQVQVTCRATSGDDSSSLRRDDATVVVAPTRLPRFADNARLWGVFAPVWSAWSARRPEVHLGQLDRVGEWTAAFGAQLVGTLPMLATFLDEPRDPSPYSPVSRQWWNEALVDLDACVGIADCAQARALRGGVVPDDPSEPYDACTQWIATRAVLAALAAHGRDDPVIAAQVDAFVAANPGVVDYARFRATVERTGTGWHAWDPAARDGQLGAGIDDADVRVWIHAQWEVHRQLAALAARMDARGQQLYLDLALGANGDGFDTWRNQTLFGWGAAVGAPPDEFFTAGQNWGFPPVRPEVSRATGHDYVAACLRAHLQVCTVLRLDHVMGFQRLFWIPDGMTAADGVYVKQPMEELLAVLSVEAWRAGAVVIGENLGTVDPGVDQAMDVHGLYGMYVGQFEIPADADADMALPGPGVLASVNTHDTPSFAGWLAADDADRRRDMGLLDDAGVAAQRHIRAAQVSRLRVELAQRAGRDPVADDLAVTDGTAAVSLLAGLLEMLGASDAPAVLVSVDDLVAAVEPQNVPGTPADRPNWVLRLPVDMNDLAGNKTVTEVLVRLNASRLASAGDGDAATVRPLP